MPMVDKATFLLPKSPYYPVQRPLNLSKECQRAANYNINLEFTALA